MSYIVGPPVRNVADFYGRSQQTRRFFQLIGGSQPQSISVLGVRRSGKTSFLYHVADPLVKSRHLRNPERTVLAYLDMSRCHTADEFYGQVLRSLRSGLRQVNALPPTARGETGLFAVESVLTSFPDLRFVLLVDEFDHLLAGGFRQEFLTELRALSGGWEYELAFVTASYNELHALGATFGLPPTSPFYNVFHPSSIYLDGLDGRDVKSLIVEPARRLRISYGRQELNAIRTLAGTQPFALQATADYWARQKQAGNSLEPEQVERQLVRSLGSYFGLWWDGFDPCERSLLREAATGGRLQDAACGRREQKEAVRRLENYGVLVKEGRRHGVNGRAFATWIATRAPR